MRGGRGASREVGGPAVCVVAAHKRHARGSARLKAWGPRARAERTRNISLMVVTPEVSKLSGWLKADAACRVEGRACEGRACRVEGGGRCEPGGRRAWGGGGTQEACTWMWPDSRLEGQGHARSAP